MRQEPSEQTSYYCDQLKDMRTRGQLQEAYQLGRQLHERFPSDEYIERAFSWVVYDCLKRYKDEKSKYRKDLPAFLKTLRMIPSFSFDACTNDLFFENIAKYLVPNLGWDLRSEKNIPALQNLLACLIELNSGEKSRVYETMIAYLEEPIRALGWDYRKASDLDGLIGLLHTILSLGDTSALFKNRDMLLMFVKGFEPCKNPSDTPSTQAKKAEGAATLVEWFGLENLTQDMFQEEKYQEKIQQSLAEKLVNRYIDALGLRNQNGQFIFDDARIRIGLNSLENALQSPRTEQWVWPQYKYGKLLMQIDGAQKARPFFARVLLDKWGESYIWGAFADTFVGEDSTAYAKCLFRGLKLSRNTGFSLALHEKAMLYLKSIQKYPEAKREALTVSEYRQTQGWPESSIVETERNEDWFAVEAPNDNDELYHELSIGSEAYVFPYASKVNFYVEWKDDEKGLMGIASEEIESSDPQPGIYSYRTIYTHVPNWAQGIRRTVIKDREMMRLMEIGACYTGVLSKDGRTILGGIENCTSEKFAKRFSIEFEGIFDLVRYKDKQGNDKTIGFVRNTQRGSIFIAPNLFNNSSLTAFDIVKGTARAIFKDEQWTMEATSIEFLDKPNPEDVEKEISGTFESTRQSFGFIGDCFVPKSLVFAEKLRDYDHVTVLARKSWDKKKEKWSWTAVKVTNREPSD